MGDEFNRALGLAGTRIVDGVGSFLPGALVFLSLLLVAFVIIAPNGLVGLVQSWQRERSPK